MLYYNATEEFSTKVNEVERLIELATENTPDRELFLKLAAISLVTKFQVFVENLMQEFSEKLKGVPSKKLPIHMRINSILLRNEKSPLDLIKKKPIPYGPNEFNEIKKFINDINRLHKGYKIDDSFNIKLTFPLGKTGQEELIHLFQQIKGEKEPFKNFDTESMKFNQLNSHLYRRHNAVHHDSFFGTERDLRDGVNFFRNLATYMDDYLNVTNFICE